MQEKNEIVNLYDNHLCATCYKLNRMKNKLQLLLVLLYLIPYSISAQKVWKKETEFAGLARFGAISFSIDGKGYIGLGRSDFDNLVHDFWEYDTLTGIWTRKADYPGKGRLGAFAFSIGSKGYVGGGNDDNYLSVGDFWEYDPASDKWTLKKSFAGKSRIGAVSFSIGTKGYVGTGMRIGSPSNEYPNDFWEYDPVSNKWTQKANFAGPQRSFAAGFSMNGKGYIGTGAILSTVTTSYKDFWEYDPVNDTWVRKNDFPGTERDQAVGFSIGSKGYIGTGSTGNGEGFDDFWEYDSGTGEWRKHVNITMGVRRFAVGFTIGSKGYVGTGVNSLAWYSNDFLQFDPAIAIGINKNDMEKSVSVFPNPCTDWLIVRTSIPVSEITVSTVLGQELIRQPVDISKPEVRIDLSNQTNGVYFVQMYTKLGVVSKKIIISGK